MVRIGVLTSSRADFGVYLPLLKAFDADKDIDFKIIAFGTHLSNLHGYTIDEIEKNGFKADYKIISFIANDSENAISTAASLTSLKFSDFWNEHKKEFDIILCLGDRYEMFSAVIAGVPFGIKFAHFYGGDYSDGAIDNIYRDAMTHCSKLHFTSTEKCAKRVEKLANNPFAIDVVGILSLHDIEKLKLLNLNDFFEVWKINLKLPTILVTFHPETILPENNFKYSEIIFETLSEIQKMYQLVITMPNADTYGVLYRKIYEKLANNYPKQIHLIENFGLQSYFSCMKYSRLMLGNTSSGISESATFNKFFINVGDRQKGREIGQNIIPVSYNKELILHAVQNTITKGEFHGENIYRKENVIETILTRFKQYSKV